jgi:hypothetical protein
MDEFILQFGMQRTQLLGFELKQNEMEERL